MSDTHRSHQKKVYAQINALQFLRGIAACLVVAYHAGGIIASDTYQNSNQIHNLTLEFRRGVDLFFVISGFVISMPVFFPSKQRTQIFFLANRLLRIIPLSAITAIIFFFGTIAIGAAFKDQFAVLITSMFLFPYSEGSNPGVLWTLKQEAIFYILFSFVFINRSFGMILILCWGLASYFIFFNNYYLNIIFFEQNVQFLFGIIACWACSKFELSKSLSRRLLFCFSTLFIIAMLSSQLYELKSTSLTLLYGTLSLSIVFTAYYTQFKCSKVLNSLGTASFSIYLIHYLFISITNKFIYSLPFEMSDWLTFSILILISTFGGLIFYRLFEQNIEIYRGQVMRKMFTS